MLRRLGLFFAALALFSIAGGHWAVLQTVAWAEMLRDYAQRTGSVAVAVQQTFDGAHPCELCRQIASARQQEKAGDRLPTPDNGKSAKADKPQKAIPPDPIRPVYVPCGLIPTGTACTQDFPLSRDDQPPTPPPRAALEV